MPFIGNQPALSYTSFAKQDFSTSATTSYTLDNPVANANELALFINFVRQEPTTAYSASGTTLTLTSATASSDDMYCVYLGKAIQTVNPPNASVGASQLVDASITSGKLASGVLPTNTPFFSVYNSSGQSIASNTTTKIEFNTELHDTSNVFSSHRFTVPSGEGGKYELGISVRRSNFAGSRGYVILIRNGSNEFGYFEEAGNGSGDNYNTIGGVVVKDFSAGDYVEAFFYHNDSGSRTLTGGEQFQRFFGYKLIGV